MSDETDKPWWKYSIFAMLIGWIIGAVTMIALQACCVLP